jgi:hypothetical protein
VTNSGNYQRAKSQTFSRQHGAYGLVTLPENPRLWTAREVVEVFNRKAKHVITFLGFGELGYEDEAELFRITEGELANYSSNGTIVNTGTLITIGFRRGIADVYEAAKDRGFATTGIHPSMALDSPKTHALSPFVDEVFFVVDDTWGGLLQKTTTPSPTLDTLIAVSDEVVVIGGGKHTAEEMAAFLMYKKPLRFYAMDMHHATSRKWTQSSGVDVGDFRGAAYYAWLSRQGNG